MIEDQNELRNQEAIGNIPAGNFDENKINNASKELDGIISNLKSNTIFNNFFSDLDNKNKKSTIIGIKNLNTQVAGETIRGKKGERTISFNSSIFYKIKESFIKLYSKKDLNQTDWQNINILSHEYLHNRQTHLVKIINPLSLNISEGLTEIIAQIHTNNFLEVYCGNSIKYEKVENTSIYINVVDIIKPLLKKFNNDNLYKDVEIMLGRINHNDIKNELIKVMNKYDKGLSGLTMITLLSDKKIKSF